MMTESDSEPSVSLSAAETSSAMAVSSAPVASLTVTVGSSATPVTVTSRDFDDDTTSPSASVAVAVTTSVKSTSESAGGVTVKPSSWAGVSVQVPSPLSVPALSEAPSGTCEMVISRLSKLASGSKPKAMPACRSGSLPTAAPMLASLTKTWPEVTSMVPASASSAVHL